jgi:hypothetical protein
MRFHQALLIIFTVLAVRLWDRYITPILFTRHIRALAKKEPCVYDLDEVTILKFHQGRFESIIDDLKAARLPTYLIHYIKSLLIARGAYKAFLMRRELVNYKKVMFHMVRKYEGLDASLARFLSICHAEQLSPDRAREEKEKDTALHRDLQQIRGCLHILKDTRGWTKKICCVPRLPTPSYKQMFSASDDGIWCQPEGMITQIQFDRYAKVESAVHDRLRERVDREGWPIPETAKGKLFVCKQCKVKVPKNWVQRQVCWRCVDLLKRQERCPFELGQPKFLCPHSGTCFSCEMTSCNTCGLLRGDGEAVTNSIFLRAIWPVFFRRVRERDYGPLRAEIPFLRF